MEAKKRNVVGLLGIYFRGMAMGAADVVPGVSGGTIAFISGIYEELLDTIKAFNIENFKAIKSDGLVAVWRRINGQFLLALFTGIFTSIISLASLISGILEQEGQTGEKIGLWSFFFGLIIASIIYIAKQVKGWTFKDIIGILLGGALAYYITIASVSEDSNSVFFLFFAGALAISAMILPGISGSFILVLLGAYKPVIGGIKNLIEVIKAGEYSELITVGLPIGIFAIGCLVGLLTFSRVLSWLFKKHEKLTLATLTGFMIGSLNKIWPWKEVLDTRINSEGEIIPTVTGNLSPNSFELMYKMESFLPYAIGFAVLGFAIVYGLEIIGNKFKNEQ
ncbi:MAG: DUF368 domain-containing protein [Flavobacteriales bacterium]|nr:DUF368 domain-containing protein [Flavobacteriales bacterium]|tara:strand:- start:168 stop:1175 length:1008 start_codon:yes stop_codon:yes gene_type:complete